MISRDEAIQLLHNKLSHRGIEPLSEQESLTIKILIKEISSLAQARRLEIESYQRISEVCPDIKIPEEININVRDKNGDTALIIAVSNGHKEAVQALLEAKADTDIKGAIGSALIVASYHCELEIVQALIAAKANLNLQSYIGDTALIWAATAPNPEIARALLEAKANLEVVNKDGKTALDLAIEYQKIKTVRLLLTHGAVIKHPDQLFTFLNGCDQEDPDVCFCYHYLTKSSRSPEVKQAVKEEKLPSTPTNKNERIIFISEPASKQADHRYSKRPFFPGPKKSYETDPLIPKDSDEKNKRQCIIM